MARILLIRHGTIDGIGKIMYGRTPGVGLNERGRAEAAALGLQLEQAGIRRIFSSPMQRALETAAPLSSRIGVEVIGVEDLNEIDFGEWSSHSVADLLSSPTWQAFNTNRSLVTIPGGECLLGVQTRMIRFLSEAARQFEDETIAVFSHADPLKTAIAHVVGLPIDSIPRIEISPASVSIVHWDKHNVRILCINCPGTAAVVNPWC